MDGIFVRGIEEDKINQMMVESIKAIAAEMDIGIVAECVETEAALNLLKNIGVDYIQGFYLDRGRRLSEM